MGVIICHDAVATLVAYFSSGANITLLGFEGHGVVDAASVHLRVRQASSAKLALRLVISAASDNSAAAAPHVTGRFCARSYPGNILETNAS